jgi:hypothetical protein
MPLDNIAMISLLVASLEVKKMTDMNMKRGLNLTPNEGMKFR